MPPATPRRRRLPPLQPGDIVLVRHKKHFARHLLRTVLGGYWDHCGMILYPKNVKIGLRRAVLVEVKQDRSFTRIKQRGVSLHVLDRYLERPDLYEIGIKRMTGLSDEERRRAVTFMLTNVDAPYWPWESLRLLLAGIFPALRSAYLETQRFGCSGLIQKAYYDSVEWERKRDVVFKEGLWSPIEMTELVSPADIARSPNATWIFNRH